jgi:tetratricopeptide (TPR) repeat protein
MKSQLRCILFALIAVPAACGGDRSASTADSRRLVPEPVAPPVAIAAPGPARAAPAMPEPAPAPVPAPLPTTYREALAQGKALAASGDAAGGRALLEAASKLDRKAAEPQLELARLFIATGERGLAMTAARKAVKLAPDSSPAYNTLGRAELARFDYDGAIDAFVHAVELDPDNVWAWNNLGFAHLQRKHYHEALDALVEATRRKGAEGYMWNNLGTVHEHLDQLDDARAAFEAGGKLGSKQALASRKRLDGVKTIVVMKAEPSKPASGARPTERGYDLAEPMPPTPAPEAASDAAGDPASDAAADPASDAEATPEAATPEAAKPGAAKPAEAPPAPSSL